MQYTTYLAGPIEHDKDAISWREKIKDMLKECNLLVYDPVCQESSKVQKSSTEYAKYITGLKQGGHWTKFLTEMNKIWLGKVEPQTQDSLIDIFKQLRADKAIHGNASRDLSWWGDYEAVIRSDFSSELWVHYRLFLRNLK